MKRFRQGSIDQSPRSTRSVAPTSSLIASVACRAATIAVTVPSTPAVSQVGLEPAGGGSGKTHLRHGVACDASYNARGSAAADSRRAGSTVVVRPVVPTAPP